MTLAAIDDVGDAFDATRQFLFPFDARTWLRLAVVAFFVGGAGGAGSGAGGGDGGGGMGEVPFLDGGPIGPIGLSDAAIAAIVVLVVVLVVLAVAFAVVSSIMEFVLVESLRQEAVHLRRFTRRYWRGGVRLFGFRLGVGLLALAVVGAVVGGLLLGLGALGPGDPGPVRLAAGLLVGLPVVLVVGVTAAVVLGLTTAFVVPVMLLEGTTVLGGWRRFWPTLRREWREYVVYVLVSFVLRLVVGAGVAIVVGVVALLLLLPLGLVGAVGFAVTGGHLGPAALVGIGVLGAAAALVLAVVWAVVQVPVVTYFRYYALLVLGDTEAAFDVIAERRAAVRAGDAAA